MANRKFVDAAARYERRLRKLSGQPYVLRLYITGATPASQRAIANLKAVCETRLHGQYQLEVIDIYQQPGLASEQQVLAAPTLLKLLPPPVRRYVGDLSGLEEKLFGVEVHPSEGTPPT